MPEIRIGAINAFISLYLRENQVVVVPCGGGGGVYYALDEVKVVPPDEREVERAISDAIRVSAQAFDKPLPADQSARKFPVLKALGLKSERAFNVNVSYCGLSIFEGKIEVIPSKPAKNKRGFEFDGDPIQVQDMGSIGKTVLRCLQDSSRLNPP